MLYVTKVELDLMSDMDQILFVENNLRGGMAYVSQRYCKAGKHMDANMKKFFTELLYIDGNNLYLSFFLHMY